MLYFSCTELMEVIAQGEEGEEGGPQNQMRGRPKWIERGKREPVPHEGEGGGEGVEGAGGGHGASGGGGEGAEEEEGVDKVAEEEGPQVAKPEV